MENGDRPATKKDLEEMRASTKQDMDQLREDLRTAMKQDLIDMETRILKAFYGYARTNDKNMKQLGLSYVGVSERVEVIERRVLDMEERLNMPPWPIPPSTSL
jgi:DNA-directed RNA polymerase sigma subunit (sigma70/sigma32)